MDRVQQQVTSIRSDLQEQIDRVVREAKTKLRTEFRAMLNRKVVLLEARVETKANKICQDTASTLKELKSIVTAICESQEKMWPTIEGIRKKYRVGSVDCWHRWQ